MEQQALTFWDYVKAAFNWKVRIPLMGDLPLNKLALFGFFILGVGHRGFWFLGMAYEAAYLMFLAGNGRFQKLVQGMNLEKHSAQFALRKQQFYAGLDKVSKARYDQLFERCIEIMKAIRNLPGHLGKMELESQGLNQLQWLFLKLLSSRNKILKILSEVRREDIEKEIEKLTQTMSTVSQTSSMYRSLEGTLAIQQRRLENIEKAKENLSITEAELVRIENQVNLLKEEMTVSSDADLLSIRLDGVLDSVQGTARWMADNAELFGSMEDEPIPPVLKLKERS